MAAEMAMLNIRMERSLREGGNAVLAEMGVTPSQLIRALWEKLVGDKQEAVAQVDVIMEPAHTSDKQAEIDRKLAALERGGRLFYEFAERFNLDVTSHVPITDEELEEERYQFYLEKYEE